MNIITSARERAINGFRETIYDNPIVAKDFRTRMRGNKAFVTMGAYVLVMGLAIFFAFLNMSSHGSRVMTTPAYGMDLFVVLTWAQTVLLTLIIPAQTAGAISTEIEKRTIEMLVLTPLTAGKIIIGKQFSAFLYALILLVCSVPLAGICLMLGGISPAEIFITYMLLAGWAFLMTCSAAMWSTFSPRTAHASGNATGLSLLYFIYTAYTEAPMALGGSGPASSVPNPFALLNPGWAPYLSLATAPILGMQVPVALVGFLHSVSYGVLFLLIASTHIKYHRVERALSIRILLILLSLANIILTPVAMSGGYAVSKVGSYGWMSIFQMIIFAAVFSTGEIKKRPNESMLKYAFSWRKAFKTDVGGAMTFILYWAILEYALLTAMDWTYGGTFTGAGRSAILLDSLAAGVKIICVLAGFCAIGATASCATTKRRNAIAIFSLFALLPYVVYEFALINTLTIRWPQLSAWIGATLPLAPDMNRPLCENQWLVTSLYFLILGFVALSIAPKLLARTGGVKDEID